ncbi:MAG: response regulator [Rhodobiaceae bacterium]|nr:response regulator [Rhodobiaceae bacterium]
MSSSPMDDIDLSDLRFLIAEENRYMLTVLRQQLKAFEIKELAEARDGDDAAQILHASEVDFAIVDSGMAPVDGLSFTRHVRTGKGVPNAELPVIVLIAHPSVETIAAARDAGATDVLCKPVSAQLLFDRIQYAVKHCRDFVKTEGFVGPDRRRRKDGHPASGEERRDNPAEI